MPELLTFEQFRSVLAEYLGVDIAEVSPETRLFDELMIDSIQMFEITVMLEEISGSPLPPELLAQLVSVGDIYHHYELYTRQRA